LLVFVRRREKKNILSLYFPLDLSCGIQNIISSLLIYSRLLADAKKKKVPLSAASYDHLLSLLASNDCFHDALKLYTEAQTGEYFHKSILIFFFVFPFSYP
jgi:hypothetical protein